MTATSIVAYLLLFASVGFLFVFAALLVGWLLRPRASVPERRDVYECGEPAVGSSFVQFDLRFYVVALVFIIFDVEVAFFFPWASVFGKANRLAAASLPKVVSAAQGGGAVASLALSPEAARSLRHLGVRNPGLPAPQSGPERNAADIQATARQLARAAMADMAVFFGVLLVGFAYVWSRGDLDWVRALPRRSSAGAAGREAASAASIE